VHYFIYEDIGPKRDRVTGEWRKAHEELYYLYSSSNIIRVIKSRRVREAGHVAQETTDTYRWERDLK